MRDDMFRVEGDIHIPDGKKEIMNSFALQLLDRCGIRQTEEMEVGGRKLLVAALPRPDKDGTVKFNYSVFEKEIRKQASYDTRTCLLDAPDKAFAEFCMAMNMVMVIQSMFSDNECHFMQGDEEGPVDAYLNVALPLLTDRNDGVGGRKKPGAWHLLYVRFMRENEDEFLEFWDKDNLLLSDSLAAKIKEWGRRFKEDAGVPDMPMEKLLADTVSEMYGDWGCRLVDKAFIEEFLAHRDDKRYRKALWLLRSYVDEGLEYLPELTRRQAVDWIAKRGRAKHDAVIMSAFQSLLANHKMRHWLFGF